MLWNNKNKSAFRRPSVESSDFRREGEMLVASIRHLLHLTAVRRSVSPLSCITCLSLPCTFTYLWCACASSLEIATFYEWLRLYSILLSFLSFAIVDCSSCRGHQQYFRWILAVYASSLPSSPSPMDIQIAPTAAPMSVKYKTGKPLLVITSI